MKKTTVAVLVLVIVPALLFAQSGSINNTLGSGGTFTVKDGSTTFMSLSQSTGYFSLNKSLTLPVTTGSTLGIIFKGADRFIHDYQASGTNGANTFVGVNAGNFVMSGSGVQCSYNTAVGNASLTLLSTGNNNAAFGYQTLNSNTAGSNNSAFGFDALYQNTGSSNTSLGCAAGYNITSGSNNSCIGYQAWASSATASNEVTLGNSSVGTLRCQVTSITSLSDARDKRDIRELTLGIDFLMKVRPRLFNWDRREWYKDGKPDGSKMQTAPSAGFIAQELDAVQTKEGVEWLNLVLKSNPDRLEATPGNLIPIMVKAIQELKTENDALKNEVVTLRSTISEEVKKEVRTVLLKAAQQDDAKTKVSLNETQN
jgi:hypothetical protein